MSYDLIPDQIYDSLPDDPQEKFALLARAAQSNALRLIDEATENHLVEEVRLQFMETIRGIAEALEIEGLPTRTELQELSSWDEYTRFNVRVAGLIARAKLKSLDIARPYSVQLGRVTKARVRQEAEQLRVYINESDLDERRKKSASEQLDRLIRELDKQRLSFAVVAAITAALATTINQSVSAIPRLPEAYETITNILSSIGSDKEREDNERERLAPPPQKTLPKPSELPKPTSTWASLDDDIPF